MSSVIFSAALELPKSARPVPTPSGELAEVRGEQLAWEEREEDIHFDFSDSV